MNRSSLCLAAFLAASVLGFPQPRLLAQEDASAPDSSVKASSSDDWFSGDSAWVTSVARIGETRRFVASTANGLLLRPSSVVSFDASNPNRFTKLYEHPAATWCVAATDDGRAVASVDYRGNLVTFDVPSGVATTHEKALERWCQTLVVAPDQGSWVAGNEAGKILVWGRESGKVEKTAELDGHAVTGIAFAPDASQMAVTDGGGHVHLVAWPSLDPLGKIELSESAAWCVAFDRDGANLFVGSADRNVYRCAAKADAKPDVIAKGLDWITEMDVSSTGELACGEVSGRVHLVQPNADTKNSLVVPSGVWALAFDGDGQVVIGTRKHGIRVASRSWSIEAPQSTQASEHEASDHEASEHEGGEPSDE